MATKEEKEGRDANIAGGSSKTRDVVEPRLSQTRAKSGGLSSRAKVQKYGSCLVLFRLVQYT